MLGLDDVFKQPSSVTRGLENDLRYTRIDRYDITFIGSTNLKSLVDWVNTQERIDLYFAFGKVCIGYLDRDYGNNIRLSAFVQVPGLDLTNQEDKGVFQ